MATGSCLCGSIRYTLDRPIEEIDHCHCSMCRRFHGAAFATYGRVPRQALGFALEQEPSANLALGSIAVYVISQLSVNRVIPHRSVNQTGILAAIKKFIQMANLIVLLS